MGAQAFALIVLVSIVVAWDSVGAATLGEQCADSLQKLTTCLPFANGKSAAPTKDCCTSVTSIDESKKICLCYIIQQIHNGTNPNLRAMGIKEDRLLQLPSACKLANATSSDCPKLLNLPPNSPDAAIFADPSPATTTPTATKGTSSSPVTAGVSNIGIKHVPQLAAAGSIAISIAHIFFYAF